MCCSSDPHEMFKLLVCAGRVAIHRNNIGRPALELVEQVLRHFLVFVVSLFGCGTQRNSLHIWRAKPNPRALSRQNITASAQVVCAPTKVDPPFFSPTAKWKSGKNNVSLLCFETTCARMCQGQSTTCLVSATCVW
jgi:hypothetical protein